MPDLYLQNPPEDVTYRFVLQNHCRGKSAHGDFRYEFQPGKVLLGWTLNIIKSLEKRPGNLKEAKESSEKGMGDFVELCHDPERKAVCERKKPEPYQWLSLDNATFPPGTVGACLGKGVPVLTTRGLVPIEEIQVGDMVLSHQGLKIVTDTHITDPEKRNCYHIWGQGLNSVIATEDHMFLTGRKWYGNSKAPSKKIVDIKFETAKSIFESIGKHSKSKRYPGSVVSMSKVFVIPRTEEINPSKGTYDEGLIMGFAFGDGYCRADGRVELYFNAGKEGRLARFYEHILTNLNLHPSLNRIRKGHAYKIGTIDITFFSANFLLQFQTFLNDPSSIFSFSKSYAEGFYQGMLDADGYSNTISQKRNSMKMAVLQFACFHADRFLVLRQDERFDLDYIIGIKGLFSECGKYLIRHFNIRKTETPAMTFNISVEGAETYFVPNLISHNTAALFGYMYIIDKGKIEICAQKPTFNEYYVWGTKRWKGKRIMWGRFVIRALPNVWRKKSLATGEPEKTGKGYLVHMAWFPDEEPYCLSARAVKKEWMPPIGISALPRYIRKQVPEEFQYWKRKTKESARKMRDELFAAMKKGNIKVSFEIKTD